MEKVFASVRSPLEIPVAVARTSQSPFPSGWLVDFFKRINYKKGRATAVTALARKLAVIIWNMLVKGQNYNPPTQYLFLDEKRKMGMVKRIQKQITKFGLTNEDLSFITN